MTSVLDGKLIDFGGHCGRLRRSLGELKMRLDMSDEDLLEIHRQLVIRNDLEEGLIYLQVTRGAVDRDFAFPPEETPSTLVLFTQVKSLIDSPLAERGQKILPSRISAGGAATSRQFSCCFRLLQRWRQKTGAATMHG